MQNEEGEIILSGDLPTPLEIWKKYPECKVVYVKEKIPTDIDEESKQLVEHYTQPATFDVIYSHLLRLAAEKKIVGDQNQINYILTDRVNRLKGASELQVFNAVEWFIENDESNFFPNTAVLKKKVFE